MVPPSRFMETGTFIHYFARNHQVAGRDNNFARIVEKNLAAYQTTCRVENRGSVQNDTSFLPDDHRTHAVIIAGMRERDKTAMLIKIPLSFRRKQFTACPPAVRNVSGDPLLNGQHQERSCTLLLKFRQDNDFPHHIRHGAITDQSSHADQCSSIVK